ncbi:segregation/condensation protein A [Candidatus Woesearchaeota archaeon]|nr:segregation/condensation protein A [Candidatus Woesearchaeota archaeon]
MQERIFSMLLQENEVTWQSILYDLVRSEEMNPWDIDITDLTKKYIEMLKKLNGMDFRISGKVVLAATTLLKLKSKRFVDTDISNFNDMMNMQNEEENMFYDEEYPMDEIDYEEALERGQPALIPRTPQPRKRKVSIFDLIEALNQALVVQDRRVLQKVETTVMEAPEKKTDISVIIKQVHQKIESMFVHNKKLKFSKLIPSTSKEDVVLTFIPLLHLSNMRSVDLDQREHFGELYITMLKKMSEVE